MAQSYRRRAMTPKRMFIVFICTLATTITLMRLTDLMKDNIRNLTLKPKGPTVKLLEDPHVYFLCDGFTSPDWRPCLCYYDFSKVSETTPIPEATSVNDLKLVRLLRGRCAMTVNACGRLGNLMGEYAVLYALAKRNGRPAFMLKAMANVLSQHFSVSMPIISDVLMDRTKGVWTERWVKYWMEDEYAHIDDTFLLITGYPYSWTYFHHVRDEILREFSFSEEVIDAVRRKLLEVRDGRRSVTYVGVHARRSDYVKVFMEPANRGVLADADFFRKATNYFRSRYPDCVFVVASDDLRWCRENLDNSRKDVYFAGQGDINNPIMDMALLSSCNHSIITVGTFGFWTAYLAGGETVHLANYSKPGVEYDQLMKTDEKMYLPNWIPIAANRTSIL